MDVLTHCEHAHAEFILAGLNQLRLNEENFCDFSILVDGRHFPCHRSILCLFSTFFKGAIRGGFRECSENFLHLKNTSRDEVGTILNYFYTGKITLHHSNVESYLRISNKLGISKIVNLCTEYIRHQIDQTNCLEILKLAKEISNEVLELSARQYLNDHLCSILQFKTTQKESEIDDAFALLRDSQTHNQGEESVILAIMTWLNGDVEQRKKYASKLLNHIYWKKLRAPFLLKVLLRHPLISKDKQIKALVLKHVRQSYTEQSVQKDIADSLRPLQENDRLKPRLLSKFSAQSSINLNSVPYPNLLLVGGLTLGEAERDDTSQANVMCYHPVHRTWRQKAAWPERGLRGFSVSILDNDVVVTGGCATMVSKHVIIKRAWLYIVNKDQWRQLPDMTKPRAFHTSCSLHSQFYVVGGSSGDELDVEFFDHHLLKWKGVKKSAPRLMFNFTATACNAKLIVIGNGVTSTLFIQCYNPAVDLWTVIRSPNVPRHLSSPVVVTANDEKKIFVCGDNTKKLYIFDPNTNSWSRGGDMNNLHSNGNLIILGEEIYHTGGHWEADGYWDEMESYNVETNIWTSKGALPHLWLYHSCASIFVDE